MIYECINNQSTIDSPHLQKLYDQKELYNCDLKTQRQFTWDIERQRQLIISLFKNIIPSILTANIIKNEIRMVDGRQRLSTIFNFLDNKFSFDNDTIIKINNTEYNVSNMFFKDLNEQLKIRLLSQNIRIEKYFDLTEDEEVDLMVRLNNGKSFSKVERAKLYNYGNINDFISEIKNTDLFKRKVSIAETFKKKLLDDKILIAIFASECNLNDVSFQNVEEISKRIRENELLTKKNKERIMDTIKYIDLCIPVKQKWLNTNNFIPIYKVCKELNDKKINPRVGFSLLESFFMSNNAEYNSIKSNKWNSKSASEKRFYILKKYIEECLYNRDCFY